MAAIKSPIKKQYDVKVEALIPGILVFRVWAETPEQALILIKNIPPTSVKYKLSGYKPLKATIYDAYTTTIRFIKNLMSR